MVLSSAFFCPVLISCGLEFVVWHFWFYFEGSLLVCFVVLHNSCLFPPPWLSVPPWLVSPLFLPFNLCASLCLCQFSIYLPASIPGVFPLFPGLWPLVFFLNYLGFVWLHWTYCLFLTLACLHLCPKFMFVVFPVPLWHIGRWGE